MPIKYRDYTIFKQRNIHKIREMLVFLTFKGLNTKCFFPQFRKRKDDPRLNRRHMPNTCHLKCGKKKNELTFFIKDYAPFLQYRTSGEIQKVLPNVY